MALNTSKNVLARLAYRQVMLNGRENIPEHELEDAVYYVDMAIDVIKATATYDPEELAIPLSEQAIIQFVKLSLLGFNPQTHQDFIIALDNWMKDAAKEHYADHPDSYPDWPRRRTRLRDQSQKVFCPPTEEEEPNAIDSCDNI